MEKVEEKLGFPELGSKETRLLKSYKKAADALTEKKRKLLWQLADLSNEEKKILEKHDKAGELLNGAKEGEAWARARRKIEDAKMKFKDILDIPDLRQV